MAVASSSSSPSRARSDKPKLYRSRSSPASLSSGFESSTPPFLSRSSSTTPVSAYARSVFSSSRYVSSELGRPISVNKQRRFGGNGNRTGNGSGMVSSKKKMCMCSPTTLPGSFQCYVRKNSPRGGRDQTPSFQSNSSRLLRMAIENSLARIGGAEGGMVKRALSALSGPPSPQQPRRAAFKPTPSRLSVMSRA